MAKHYPTLAAYFEARVETQEALALRAGVTQSHISRIASGDSCSLALATLLSRLTGVPMESFGREEVA